MTDHTPSGQQAVEQMLREEICRMTGWNLSKDDCRNIVEKIHTAAPTAPSTAAGEKTSAVKQMERSPERWANMSPDVVADGSRAQVAYALKDAQHDIALLVAALATPPAQEGGGGEHDGYKEAAIAWAVCASIHREYAKGRDPLYTTRQADYMKAHEAARTKAMRAAQEDTGNG